MGREVAGAEGGPPLGDEQVDGDQAQHRQCHAHYTQGARSAVSTNRFFRRSVRLRPCVYKYPFVTNLTSGKRSVADIGRTRIRRNVFVFMAVFLASL